MESSITKTNESAMKKILKNQYFSLIVILIVLFVFFTIINHNFIKPVNLLNILLKGVTAGFLAIAETLLIISGNIDLSVGTIGATAGVICALMINAKVAWPLAILVVLIAGAAMGGFNAILINIFNFQSFIATLATMNVFKGLAYILAKGATISIGSHDFFDLGTGYFLGVIPYPILIMLVLFVIYGVLLARTRFGRSLYMIGGNRNAARLAGLKPKKISTGLFLNAGALAALAGIIVDARMHSGAPGAVAGTEFDGITAAILGGVAFTGGAGTMGGCFVGLLVLSCFNNGTTFIGVSTYYSMILTGALLIFALMLEFYRTKKRKKKV